MKEAFLSLLILFFCGFARAEPNSLFLYDRLDKANAAYKNRKTDNALSMYSKIVADYPDSGIASFNIGALLYKKNKYADSLLFCAKAVKLFSVPGQESLLSKAYYNAACAKYRLSESMGTDNLDAMRNTFVLLKEVLEYYKLSVKNESDDLDAKYNYEFVLRKLKKLEEMIKQQEEILRLREEERRRKEEAARKQEEEKEIEAEVPVFPQGRSVGEKKDGTILEQKLKVVSVKAKPSRIPSRILVDVSPLKKEGDAIKVKDIDAGDEVKVISEAQQDVFVLNPDAGDKKEEKKKKTDDQDLSPDAQKDSSDKMSADASQEEEDGSSPEDKEILLDTYRELEEQTRGGNEITIPPFDISEPEKDW